MAVLKVKRNGQWVAVGVGERGEQGVRGEQGIQGVDGKGIQSIQANGKTTVAGNYTRNEYVVTYTDGATSNMYINALNGEKGRSVSTIEYYKTPEQPDENSIQYQMSFKDDDETSISTPIFSVPKGAKGDKGDVGATFTYDASTKTLTITT